MLSLYLKWVLIMGFVYPIGFYGKTELIQGLPSNIHLRCPQVLHRIPQWFQYYMAICVNTHWFPLKMSIAAVTLTEIKLIWFKYVG